MNHPTYGNFGVWIDEIFGVSIYGTVSQIRDDGKIDRKFQYQQRN